MKIVEFRKSREVVVNNKWKFGGVLIKVKCENCDELLLYFDKYDSNICVHCNEWKQGCNDPGCYYCSKRPLTTLHEFY